MERNGSIGERRARDGREWKRLGEMRREEGRGGEGNMAQPSAYVGRSETSDSIAKDFNNRTVVKRFSPTLYQEL